MTPVAAWAAIVEDDKKRKSYTAIRGHGGFVRAHWDEVTEIIAAANAYIRKKAWARPDHRLFADPGDVDGQLCRGLALPVADRRHLHVLL
jgi:hypothetical protein